MSQAIPAITIQANVPYEFTVPESPAPATYLVVTNTGASPIQWMIGSSSGHIPNGMTGIVHTDAANTQVQFVSDVTTVIYITVWTQNDGALHVPQGAPISSVLIGNLVNANITNSSVPVNGSVGITGTVTIIGDPITSGVPNLGSTPNTPTTLSGGALVVPTANTWEDAFSATSSILLTDLMLAFSTTSAGNWFAFQVVRSSGAIVPLGPPIPIFEGSPVVLSKNIGMANGDVLQACSSIAVTAVGFWGINWI